MHVGTVTGAISLGALLLACDGSPAAPASTAEIAVSNQTSGDPIESDGYQVRVDGDGGHALRWAGPYC